MGPTMASDEGRCRSVAVVSWPMEPLEAEERWQEAGRLLRRLDPLWLEAILIGLEARLDASVSKSIDESYSEA
jgi:myo-inositol catabolism protein IolC